MFTRYGKCRRPQYYRCPKACGGEPYRMGVNGAHNTVGKMSAPTTLLGFYHAKKVAGYCPAGVQGMILGIVVDLSALPYFLHPFPGPYRAGIPDRLVPVGFGCASQRGVVSRGSVHSRSEKQVGVGSGVWPGLSVGEAVRRRAKVGGEAFRSERRARVESGRRSSSVRPSGQRVDCPFGLSFGCLGRPRCCASFATLSAGLSSCWEAGP